MSKVNWFMERSLVFRFLWFTWASWGYLKGDRRRYLTNFRRSWRRFNELHTMDYDRT